MKSTVIYRGTTFYTRDPDVEGEEWTKYPISLLLSVTPTGIKIDDNNDHLNIRFTCSFDLQVKTALVCAGLLPVPIYADALQEEIPEAEWAAQQLREWAKWVEK